MKKILILLTCFIFFAEANATIKSNKIIGINENKTSLLPFFRMALSVTAYDQCGQVLTFNISCTSCTGTELGAAADQYIFDHTNSAGCFFL